MLAKSLVFFLICCAPFAALSNSNNQPVYVWAKNGLTLRDSPSRQSTKIKTLPYGTPVVVLRHSHEDSVVIIPAYKCPNEPLSRPIYLLGTWVWACSGRDTGYLFSGYLSDMLPYKRSAQNASPNVTDWLLQQSQVLDTRVGSKFGEYNTTVYTNHVISRVRGGEGWSWIKYIFPSGREFQDGYLLLNYFSDLTFEKKELEQCVIIKIESRPNFLEFLTSGFQGELGWMFSIYFDGEMLVIEEGAGC